MSRRPQLATGRARRGFILPRSLVPPLLSWLAALAACSTACSTEEGTAATWEVVHRELGGALFSVWGSGADDVWMVGSDDGSGPLVLRYDGEGWRRLAAGVSGDLWWVHGIAGAAVFAGGEGGLLLRAASVDGGGSGGFERLATPGVGTVFGIWAAAADDVWIVGGTGTAGGGFVWRYDGVDVRAAELPPGAEEHTVFKVWGNGPDDVLFVGSMGLMLRWDGVALTRAQSGTTRTLFTVHTLPGRAAAVGGFGNAVVMEPDAATGAFRDVAPPETIQMNGVFLTPDGGIAVGNNVVVLRRGPAGWQEWDTGLALAEGLHGVWVEPEGGVWAVGGQIASAPFGRGLVIRWGTGSAQGVIDGL